jgi:hypothetical protein
MNYTIEKPKMSFVVYLLGTVIVFALIALGIASFTAFNKIADFWQAFFSALTIEVAGIVEAMALARGKNKIGFAGMVLTLLVSGTYNYIQAEQAGRLSGITDQWQLGSLALGPLFALTVLSLTVGKEIRNHEDRVQKWGRDRQNWELEQTLRIENEQKEKEHDDMVRNNRIEHEKREQDEKDRQDRLAQEKMRMQVELEKERIRAESERLAAIEMERIRAEEERKTEIAKAKLEAKKRKILQNFVENNDFSDTIWINDWRKLPNEDKILIASMTTAEIREKYEVSERTALNWYKRARGIMPENNNGHQQD